MVQTNWYVITGGPGSGKTTTINLISALGYKTTIEHARHYIDTQMVKGRTVEEIRQNQIEFQLAILDMQIEQEALLSPDEVVFLDRAIPDALAYHQFLGLPLNERLVKAVSQVSYKKIFILELLPLVNDYARREDGEEQKRIHEIIIRVYTSLPFPVMTVPALPVKERVDFIVNHLNC
jgi:predicted ATPase